MKAYLTEQVQNASDPAQGLNVAREYLQARILGALQKCGAMLSLAFHGGTALRFIYGHERYSEDLDFALEQSPDEYDFRRYLQAIRSELQPEGYTVGLKVKDQKTVHSAFVRFPGLMYELGLSEQRNQVLAIKIEVDTNPPAGAQLETTVLRRYVALQLQHHDQASLLAGKLHAVLQQTYTKGRDYFDLFWYLSDPNWPSPNLVMLNNALEQPDWPGPELTKSNWRDITNQRIQAVDWGKVVEDVQLFLRSSFDIQLFTKANLERVLLRTDGG